MGLITKRKVPDYEEDPPMPAQDPVVHLEHLFQESADELANEAAFQQTLAASLRPVVERNRALEKRQLEKARHWLLKMSRDRETNWDKVIASIREHDERSGNFLAGLVSHAREQGLI